MDHFVGSPRSGTTRNPKWNKPSAFSTSAPSAFCDVAQTCHISSFWVNQTDESRGWRLHECCMHMNGVMNGCPSHSVNADRESQKSKCHEPQFPSPESQTHDDLKRKHPDPCRWRQGAAGTVFAKLQLTAFLVRAPWARDGASNRRTPKRFHGSATTGVKSLSEKFFNHRYEQTNHSHLKKRTAPRSASKHPSAREGLPSASRGTVCFGS